MAVTYCKEVAVTQAQNVRICYVCILVLLVWIARRHTTLSGEAELSYYVAYAVDIYC